MRNTSVDISGWSLPQYESLPGQQPLFSEREGDRTTDTRHSTARCHELFETGRDLPGAAETDQSLLWDVKYLG